MTHQWQDDAEAWQEFRAKLLAELDGVPRWGKTPDEQAAAWLLNQMLPPPEEPACGVTGPAVTATQPAHLLQEDCPCPARGSQQWQDHGTGCPWRYRLNKRMARHEKRFAAHPSLTRPNCCTCNARSSPDWKAHPANCLRREDLRNARCTCPVPSSSSCRDNHEIECAFRQVNYERAGSVPPHPSPARRIEPGNAERAGFVPTREQAAATACTCGAGRDADWKQHAPGRCEYRAALITVARHEHEEAEKIRKALDRFDDWYARREWIPPETRIPEGCCAHCHGPKEAAAFLLCRYCRDLGTGELPGQAAAGGRRVSIVPLTALLSIAFWVLLVILIVCGVM